MVQQMLYIGKAPNGKIHTPDNFETSKSADLEEPIKAEISRVQEPIEDTAKLEEKIKKPPVKKPPVKKPMARKPLVRRVMKKKEPIKQEPEEPCQEEEEQSIVPTKSYNMDFLDNLDDPAFNPFETKTAVKEVFDVSAPGDKKRDQSGTV